MADGGAELDELIKPGVANVRVVTRRTIVSKKTGARRITEMPRASISLLDRSKMKTARTSGAMREKSVHEEGGSSSDEELPDLGGLRVRSSLTSADAAAAAGEARDVGAVDSGVDMGALA